MIPAGVEAEKNTKNAIIRISMKGHSDNTKAILAVFLAAILGGGMPVFVKIGVAVIPPLTYSFLRFLFAAVLILPIILIKKPKFNKSLLPVFLISLLPAINIILFSFGIRLTSATMAQTLAAGMPFMVLVLSHFLLKERITLYKLMGVAIGFIGLFIIIVSPVINSNTSMNGAFVGNLLVFAGVVLFALYSVLSKKLQNEHSPLTISVIFIFVTMAITALAFPLEISKVNVWVPQLSFQILFGLLYVASVGGIIYYFLQQNAIKYGSPLIASLLLYLQPVCTYFWALFLLGEHLTPGFIIGAMLTFIGAIIVTFKKQN